MQSLGSDGKGGNIETKDEMARLVSSRLTEVGTAWKDSAENISGSLAAAQMRTAVGSLSKYATSCRSGSHFGKSGASCSTSRSPGTQAGKRSDNKDTRRKTSGNFSKKDEWDLHHAERIRAKVQPAARHVQLLHRPNPGSGGSGQCFFRNLAGQLRQQLPEQQHRRSSGAGGDGREVSWVRRRGSDSAVTCLAPRSWSAWQDSTMSLGVGRMAGSHCRTFCRHLPQDSQPASTSLHNGTLHSDPAACTGSNGGPGGSPRSFAMLWSISLKSCGVHLPRQNQST